MTDNTPTTKQEEGGRLLPCPFCGGDAEIVQIGNMATPKRGFEVRCTAWGCSTKKRAMVIRQPLDTAHGYAVNRWNTRAPATPPHNEDGLRKALEMMVEEKCDYMRINNLGDPETQHTIKAARQALGDIPSG